MSPPAGWTYVPCRTPTEGPSRWSRTALLVLKQLDPGGRSLGVYNRRKIAGSSDWSTHACGVAVDWAPSSREAGWRVWFVLVDSRSPDLQLVLWDGFQWGGSRGPLVVPIGAGNQHVDHLHIESRHQVAA